MFAPELLGVFPFNNATHTLCLIVLSLSAEIHKQKQHFFLAPWILSFLFHSSVLKTELKH